MGVKGSLLIKDHLAPSELRGEVQTSRVDSDSTAGVALERLWLRPFTHEARTKPGSLGLGSWAAKAWPT